jgi:hypothetical protein
VGFDLRDEAVEFLADACDGTAHSQGSNDLAFVVTHRRSDAARARNVFLVVPRPSLSARLFDFSPQRVCFGNGTLGPLLERTIGSQPLKFFVRHIRQQHFADSGTVVGPVDAERRVHTNRLGTDNLVNVDRVAAARDAQKNRLAAFAAERFEVRMGNAPYFEAGEGRQAELHGFCAEVIAPGQLVLDDVALRFERIDQLLHGGGAVAQAAAGLADAEAVWMINILLHSEENVKTRFRVQDLQHKTRQPAFIRLTTVEQGPKAKPSWDQDGSLRACCC